jgi:hypothetical protein
LLAAFAGGYVGVKLKIPAGALIGALVATVGLFHFFWIILVLITAPIVFHFWGR